MSSDFWSQALRPGLDGQSMLATLATHAPRNSRGTGGGLDGACCESAGAEIAALNRIVEEAEDAVAVVAVVLGGVDPALRRDTMRPPRRILEAKTFDLVAELAERCRRGRAGEPAADHEDGVFPLVRRIHQLHLEPVPVPFLFNRAGGDL